MTELTIALPETQEAKLELFSKAGGLDKYLDAVKAQTEGVVFDVTTAKGRKELASAASKVARSKTAVDGCRKELVAELKKLPKLIDAEGKRFRDEMDKHKEELRRPLTEWENAEKERAEAVEALRVSLHDCLSITFTAEPVDIQLALDNATDADISCANEKEIDALIDMQSKAVEHLTAALEMAEERERQAAAKAEQERIERERQQAERDAEIKRQAEENARREAAEREEQLKREAEEAEQRRIKAEQDAAEAAERAEKARVEAEAKAKRDAEEAAERARIDEQQRIESERQAKEAADRKRAEDREHARGINNAIAEQLVKEAGITEEQAKAVVRAIASNVIDHVTINY